MLLFFVECSSVRQHLGERVVTAAEVGSLLRLRALPDGMPVFLDETSLLPVEPLCSWFRHLAYEDKAAKTLREYAYIVRRFADFLAVRGRDVLGATESDLKSYQRLRTELQGRPVGDAMWGKEAQLINQLYMWLVERGYLRRRPLRVTRSGRNPMAPRLRRGIDIRHLTLDQYRFFRDVGLGGQLPDSRASGAFRGQAPLRNRGCGGPRAEHGDAAPGVVDGAVA